MVGVGDGQPAARVVDELEGHRARPGQGARPERLPGAPDARAEGEDLGHRAEHPGVETAHREELADHPGEALALLGDDRQAPVGGRPARGRPRPLAFGPASRGLLGGELVGVRPDSGQRRLQVVGDAAQEVVLLGVELDQPLVLGLHATSRSASRRATARLAANSSRRSWSAGSQRVVAGAWPTRTPATSPPGAQVGPDRLRLAGDALLVLQVVRVAEDDPGVGQSQPLARVAGGVLEQAGRAVARRPGGDRGDRPLDLAVAAGEAGGQVLLALGEAAELVVGEGRQRIGALAGGDPVEARAQRPQRRGDGADQEAAHGKPDEGRDDERGQHQGQDPACSR